MKSIELSDNLNKLIKNSGYRSILIDGPWGCGKTYEINKFMSKTKRGCIYVSLFGLESIDEINTEIYKASHPKLAKANKVFTTISKAVAPVKYVGSISDALSFQLNNIDKTKIKESLIIIIDDLERLSKKIDYKDLVGYINKLFFSKARVVCLCSTNNIDSDRLSSFNQFKEKVFDCCFSVKETDYAVYDEIFNDLSINDINLIYPLFENNIRTAKRVHLFYKDLIEHFDYQNKKYSLTKYDLIKSCTYTVLCILNSKQKPEFKDEYRKVVYEEFVSEYGESIANGIYHYLKYGSDDSIGNIHNAVLKLIDCYINRDFESFEKDMRYIDIENKELDILDKCPFYLSEDNKKIYFEKMNSYIDNLVIYNDITTRRIRDLYYYTQYMLSDRRIQKLAEVYFKTVKKEYVSKELIEGSVFPGFNKRTSAIANFVSIFTNKYLEVYIETIINSFYDAMNEEEFNKASDLINQLTNFAEEDVIKHMLIDNSFFIKDIELDISEPKWSFLNSVAKVAFRQGLQKEYIDAIESCFNDCLTDNETIRVRLTSLVRNNIDSSYTLKHR